MLAPAGRGRGLDRAAARLVRGAPSRAGRERAVRRVGPSSDASGPGPRRARPGGSTTARGDGYARSATSPTCSARASRTCRIRPLPDGLELRPVRPEDDPGGHRREGGGIRGPLGSPPDDRGRTSSGSSTIRTPILRSGWWPGTARRWPAWSWASIIRDENAAFGWRRGWLGAVGTRTPWRGRGLASALIVRALEGLRDRGLTQRRPRRRHREPLRRPGPVRATRVPGPDQLRDPVQAVHPARVGLTTDLGSMVVPDRRPTGVRQGTSAGSSRSMSPLSWPATRRGVPLAAS